MSEAAPDSLVRARETAAHLLSNARKGLRDMLGEPGGLQRFKSESVQELYRLAVIDPDHAALSVYLVDMAPADILFPHFAEKTLTVDGVSQGLSASIRMKKLIALVLESALAEQLSASGEVREGAVLLASRLEASLDDWVRAGANRAGEFQTAPLTHIARTMETQAITAEDAVVSRLGLVVPVIVNIHIWRTLEEYPAAQANSLGWRKPVAAA